MLAVPSNGPRVHGFTPSLAIVDELHAHRDDALYLAFRTGLAKRADARLVTITTAGVAGDAAGTGSATARGGGGEKWTGPATTRR